jgi:hypothetical protein
MFFEFNDVSGPHLGHENFLAYRTELLVEAVPDIVLLDVWIHSWEW